MTWSRSIRPAAKRTLNYDVTWVDLFGCLLGVVNLFFYNHLALKMFNGCIVYFSCILISTVFAGFVYQIFFPNGNLLKFLGMGTFFIVGMMIYQTFIA
jgi:hypothetical protein